MSLASVEVAVKAAVVNSEFDARGGRLRSAEQMPGDITALKVKAWALDGEARKEARKEFLKRRATWRRNNSIRTRRSAAESRGRRATFMPPMAMTIGAEPTRDRE
eukprot:8563827-Pyramimonas_sp.AAC.1